MMNLLFISLLNISSLNGHDLYSDLLRVFIRNGHHVDVISPVQKREVSEDRDIITDTYNIFKPHIGNVTNTPFIEKGISLLTIQQTYIRCIKKKIGNKKVDLLLVATPPLLDRVVNYAKKTYNAKAYLLLKDFWPGSLLDVSIPGGEAVKKLAYIYYKQFEKRLYSNSDYIGCMSPGNVDFILTDNPWLDSSKVHVNPNSIEPIEHERLSDETVRLLRTKYGIPTDKVCFVYGGTLGVGQNVSHIVECMKACKDLDCHFLIVGKGVQYHLLDEYVRQYHPQNLTLSNWLPKEDYDPLMQSCDVGMVFLRYTAQTPNIPSRILTYMDYSLPILSCTDPTTDLNRIIEGGQFGWGCVSNDPGAFRSKILEILNTDLEPYRRRSNQFLKEYFSVERSYQIIMDQIGEI